MNSSVLLAGLITAAPALLGWMVAVVLAVIMLRRGGGRAELFLTGGASLMLLRALSIVPLTGIPVWLHQKGMSPADMAQTMSWFNLGQGLIGLVGTVCLIYAFWIKFKVQSHVEPKS